MIGSLLCLTSARLGPSVPQSGPEPARSLRPSVDDADVRSDIVIKVNGMK